MSSEVFRFMTIRSVQRTATGSMQHLHIPFDLDEGVQVLKWQQESRMTREEAIAWADGFIASRDFVADPAVLETPIVALDEWLLSLSDHADPAEVSQKIADLTGVELGALPSQAGYRHERRRVARSLAALTLRPGGHKRLRTYLLRFMRLYGLIEGLASRSQWLSSSDEVSFLLHSGVVLLPGFFPVPSAALARPPAIADLRVVRQVLRGYAPGEIAHVENALKGESRERQHRRRNTREEVTSYEIEREESEDHDLQTADRFELQEETERVIAEDSHFQVGATISASYGPTVSATIDAGYETNHSKEESRRVASSYAREVTERSARRVRERVREARLTRTVVETEEVNKHLIDNTGGTEHMVGIYRFVDKLYDAQVFNYGKRLMLEFIIPEPAAFVKHSMRSLQGATAVMTEPDEPLVMENGQPRRLRPQDILENNYLLYVAQYYVRDAALPPAARWLGVAWEEAAKPDQGINPTTPARKLYKANSSLQIPEGYTATRITGTLHASDYMSNIHFTAGMTNIPLFEYGTGAFSFDVAFWRNESGLLPLNLTIENAWGYVISIMVQCVPTTAALTRWQLDTYEKIMSAYFELKAVYDQQVAELETRQGVAIRGTNPQENRTAERIELRKHVITMLEQHTFSQAPIDQDAIHTVPPDNYPEIKFDVAGDERDYIQWFEQAFEWPQMTYVFYPYYWHKKSEWMTELLRVDEDPLFAAFLKAGAARVAVPVRPGFEQAVALYLATGIIWGGDNPPQLADPLYVSLVEEIQEQQGLDGVAVPEGNSWEVRLPTPLVILQQGQDLA